MVTVEDLLSQLLQDSRTPPSSFTTVQAFLKKRHQLRVVLQLFKDYLLLAIRLDQISEVVTDAGVPSCRNLALNEVTQRFRKVYLDFRHRGLPL
jgi:hypothetical protein